ncbi:MAG: TrbI/VirB10 family protein [bacterium]
MDDELNNPHIISEETLNAENANNYSSNENRQSYTENKENKNLKDGNQNVNNIDIDTNTDIYNSVPNLKNKNNKYTFFRSFKGIIILTGIIIVIFIMFKFLYLNNVSRKYSNNKNNTMPKPINKYKNKIINYKKRFHSNIFNYASANKNNNLKTANQRKFSKKFYREMQLLKKLKNYKGNKNISNSSKKNLLPINKKIVVFIKQSYARSILKNEKEANKRANKNNIKLGNLNYYKKAANKKISYKFGESNNNTAIIPIGTVVNGYIKYKIFSYNTEVPVIAILSDTYYYKNKPFLKKGDKFFGMVSIKHSLDRLNIHFNRIIKTNGLSLGINAIAMMPNGSGGVKGNVHYHYKANVLTSLAQGVVGAAAVFAGGGSAANASNPYTFQNQIRQNVARNELGQAQNGLNSIASSAQQTTITLSKGVPIKIIFLRSVN